MKKVFFIAVVSTCLIMLNANAQNVGINTPNPTSSLDINGGLRLQTETTGVVGTSVVLPGNRSNHILTGAPSGNFTITLTGTVQEGQHIIITNTNIVNGTLGGQVIPAGTTTELIYADGGWKKIGSSEIATNSAWGLNGNNATFNNFLGTLNDVPLQFKVFNSEAGGLGRWGNVTLGGARSNNFFTQAGTGSIQNTAIGNAALQNGSVMYANTAVGFGASQNNINGHSNTAIGHNALNSNKNGTYTVAIGKDALLNDTAADQTVAVGGNALYWNNNRFGNTAVGTNSLFNNSNPDLGVLSFTTQARHNTALGHSALFNNRTGSGGVAIGYGAGFTDTHADGMVAIGRAALYYNNFNRGNVAIGDSALAYNSFGIGPSSSLALGNTAIGYQVLKENRSGSYNTSVGDLSMYSNTTGKLNSAFGASSLSNNISGSGNTANGLRTLFANTTGNNNTAVGDSAMRNNTTGYSNVAIGTKALYSNTTQSNLVAIGDSALYNNGTGANSTQATKNVAVGSKSLFNNTTGEQNTAIGFEALKNTMAGGGNTAVGSFALTSSNGTLSIGNVALGQAALANSTSGQTNTAVGTGALQFNATGIGNVAIGYSAGSNELTSNKLYIENTGANKDAALIYGDFAADSLLLNAKTINKFSLNVRGSNALELGYGAAGKQTDAGKICYGCFGDPANWLGIVGGGTAPLGTDRVIKLWSEGGLRIRGNALPDFNNTYSLGTSGQRWSEVWTNAGAINTSDARLKTNIVVSPYGLNEVMQMQPVQYNWKTNPGNDLQIGFLAQDIQKLIPEAVVEPANGDPLGMKYNELIPVLVKAIQEQQKKIDELEKMVKALQK